MKNAKRILSLMLISLLALNVFSIGVSAYEEGPELITVDVDLEVGTYNVGGDWVPWAGETLLTGQQITVRIAPTTNFLIGTGKFVVMFSKPYFKMVGQQKAAFEPNLDSPYYSTVCADWAGATGTWNSTTLEPNGLPVSAWPVDMKTVEFLTNTAVAVNNTSNLNSPNGGYPEHMTGEWLFQFKLEVKQDILVGSSGAKVWMDSRWTKRPLDPEHPEYGYPGGAMYFTKCLDSEKYSALGNATMYPFVPNLEGANILLEPVAQTSTISFNMNGATSAAIDPITLIEGAEITPPSDPIKDGFSFLGWVPSIPPTMPEEDVTCVAQWEALPTSTITFDLNGGTSALIDSITLYEGAPVTPPAPPTRDGYTFAGWLPDVPGTMPIEDVICVAKWVRNQSTIIFNSTGGTAVASITLDEGSEVSAPTPPTKAGYTFDGWYLDEALANPVTWDYTLGAGNVTFYAKWAAGEYTVTFNANGGGTPSSDTTQVTYGGTYGPLATIEREGYAFVGWFTAATEGTKVLEGDSVTIIENQTLYAQWNANTVNITFDANGGTGGGTIAMTCDSPLAAPLVTKEGFVLAGWAPVLPTTVPLTDTTYVAQWETTVVTVTMVGGEFEVNIQGWAADYQYQIWSYQKVTSDILLGNDGNVQANQWILSQGYTPGSAGTPDVSNNGSINFMIPTFTSPTENYLIAVRVADADGNFIQEIRDAYTPEALSMVVITKVLVDGAVTTGYELREIKAGAQTLIKVIGNDVPGIVYTATVRETGDNLDLSNTNEFLWNISSLQPGIYTVEITATNGGTEATQTITFELFTLATTTYGSIDEMALVPVAGGVNITPNYANGTFSFRVREPGRSAQFRSVEYTTAGTVNHPITAPGVYHVYGYVTRAGFIGTENGGYDDGLIRTLVIPRTGNGAVTMTFTANHALPNVTKGTPVIFTANAAGLGEPGTVQYSFWRYDATGYVLVQDWSTDNTLNWTSARIGSYQLEARAKGAGAGSFEVKKNLEVNITGSGETKANITSITLNTGDLEAAQAKKPIMLKAAATGTDKDELLYKFFVYDDDMKNQQLKEYSVDQHCVWTPREAGNYTIIVLVKNQVSFGKFDAIESFEVTVN